MDYSRWGLFEVLHALSLRNFNSKVVLCFETGFFLNFSIHFLCDRQISRENCDGQHFRRHLLSATYFALFSVGFLVEKKLKEEDALKVSVGKILKMLLLLLQFYCLAQKMEFLNLIG